MSSGIVCGATHKVYVHWVFVNKLHPVQFSITQHKVQRGVSSYYTWVLWFSVCIVDVLEIA